MNYPPQQPNQPGWGQPGQGQPGQGQPGQGQPGGHQGSPYPQGMGPPGGQYPPQGQPPGGRYPPQGQPQHPGFAQPGFPDPTGGGQPPKKKRTGLIIAIVAAAVVLVGGAAVTGAIVLSNGSGGSEQNASGTTGDNDGGDQNSSGTTGDNDDGADEPKASTPQDAVDAYAALSEKTMKSKGQDFDEATANEILCPAMLNLQRTQKDQLIKQSSQHPNPNDPYWAGLDSLSYKPSNVQVNGNSGTFDLEMMAHGQPQQKGTLTLNKEGNTWKVCSPPGQQPPPSP